MNLQPFTFSIQKQARPYVPGEDLKDIFVLPGITPEQGGAIVYDPENLQRPRYVPEETFRKHYHPDGDFSWALRQLRRGARVRRRQWSENRTFVWLMPDCVLTEAEMQGDGMNATVKACGGKLTLMPVFLIAAHGAGFTGWLPGYDDIFAGDWEVAS